MTHNYQTVYIEQQAQEHPTTRAILAKLGHASLVQIDNYSDVFNRKNQNFMQQRKHQSLILAIKKGEFYHDGTDRIRSYGDDIVLSSSLIRNCPYHCEYCFLHGMHKTSNILIHVNIEDYLTELKKKAAQHREAKIFLSLGYVSDLLGLEDLTSYCSYWLKNIHLHETVELEIRTKSDGFTLIRHITPPHNAVLTWSITPQAVCTQYEHGTASTMNRLMHARMALDMGWRVRLCFDPLIYYKDWKQDLLTLLEQMKKILALDKIEMVSYGVFRMGKTHFNHMKKERPGINLFHDNIQVKDALASYTPIILNELSKEAGNLLSHYFDQSILSFVHG